MAMSFAEVEMNVVRWSEKRGIIQNSTSWAQYIKAVTEFGELGDAVLKKDRAATIDALGDVLVCLINIAAIEDVDLTKCLKAAYEEIKDRKGYMNKNGVFVKEAA